MTKCVVVCFIMLAFPTKLFCCLLYTVSFSHNLYVVMSTRLGLSYIRTGVLLL